MENREDQILISRLIEAQALATPNRPAIVSVSENLDYAEMEQAANRLARYLLRIGLRRGDFVGICIERSASMSIALLAAIKTGLVYVPLDPGFPRERLEFMAEDCQLSAILMTAPTERLFEGHTRRVLLDRESATIGKESDQPLDDAPGAEDIAYILYTSGSTGKPKGVRISHRALSNLLLSMRKAPGIEQNDILLAVTTLSFDIAALELFLPLIVGACVVIATRNQVADPRQLCDLMAQSGATMMQATPLLWRMLIEAGWQGSREFKILCGGEPLRPQLAAGLVERGQLWNMYGPTETTVWSTICPIRTADQHITVGKAIDNTFLYILDEHGNPAAPGARGELYIGGRGVASGYLNRPELTAERFVPDRFQGQGAARMYGTGDLASWADNGDVEIFGRIDSQVKVRGFRIELGEIEATLSRHPAVRETAVTVRQDPAGEPALCAYFVGAQNHDSTAVELRRFLSGRMPDYMVPQFFVRLDSMPQLPNGKIDRKALPAPDYTEAAAAPEQVEEARDELEATLIRIWKAVLKIPAIDRNSHFFELGGRSILAARMFGQVEDSIGKALPLATLFQAPTIRELASVIRDTGWTPPWACLVPIRPAGTRRPIFLVHAIGGNIVNFHGFTDRIDPDQPIYGLQARGLDGKDRPHETIEEMAEHYIDSIRSVQPEGPYRLGGFSAGGVVAFEMARQLQRQGETVSLLALLDAEIRPKTSVVQALSRWRRLVLFNLRYIARVGVKPFAENKARNLRMRTRIRSKQIGGLGALNSEEAFLLAIRRYRPEPYDGTAVLFRSRDDLAKYPDPSFGWRGLILGGLHIEEIAGDHDTLFDEPHIGELVESLGNWLRLATRSEAALVGQEATIPI